MLKRFLSLPKFLCLFAGDSGNSGGFGSQTAADPPGDPRRTHEKQTVGTVTASHTMLTLQKHFRALSMPALQREAAWAEERLLGDLRQSVPQNGRAHLHIIELWGRQKKRPNKFGENFRAFFVNRKKVRKR